MFIARAAMAMDVGRANWGQRSHRRRITMRTGGPIERRSHSELRGDRIILNIKRTNANLVATITLWK
jgi:hypothetical protein